MDKEKIVPRFGDGREEINPFISPNLRKHSIVDIEEEMQQQVTQMMEDIPFETNREKIARLIRLLTYRELMQIADEFKKCSTAYETDEPHDWNMAQTLDDWAHMVEEENHVQENSKE